MQKPKTESFVLNILEIIFKGLGDYLRAFMTDGPLDLDLGQTNLSYEFFKNRQCSVWIFEPHSSTNMLGT